MTGRTADFPWCAAVVAEILAPPPLGSLLLVHHKPSWQYGYERERELQAVTTARVVEELVAGRDLPVVLAATSTTRRRGPASGSGPAASRWRHERPLRGRLGGRPPR